MDSQRPDLSGVQLAEQLTDWFWQPVPISVSEIGSGQSNFYEYCLNDPVNYVDKTGFQKVKIIKDLIEIVDEAKDAATTVNDAKQLIEYYNNVQPVELQSFKIQVQLDKARALMQIAGGYGYPEAVKIYENIKKDIEKERKQKANESCPKETKGWEYYDDPNDDKYFKNLEDWKKYSGEDRL